MSHRDLTYYMSLPYKIEIIPDSDSATFTAAIPDLDGCAAFGETIEEAYQMITEAKQLWIETAIQKGWQITEPKSEEVKEYSGRFNVRLPRSLHRRLAEIAEAEDTSLNQLVVAFLAESIGQTAKRMMLDLPTLPVLDARQLVSVSDAQDESTKGDS